MSYRLTLFDRSGHTDVWVQQQIARTSRVCAYTAPAWPGAAPAVSRVMPSTSERN